MRTRRLVPGLAAPAALLLLVVALATLQYRWVGQVSEAERAQLRESLQRRVQELGEEFDRELGRAFRVFQGNGAAIDPASPETFAIRHDEWARTSRFPGLVKTTYFARVAGRRVDLFRYVPDARRFEAADWPASLAAVRDRLTPRLPPIDAPIRGGATFVMASGSAVIPDVPALVIPLLDRQGPGFAAGPPPRGKAEVIFAVHLDSSQVILEFDRARLQESILPALVARHFPESDRYRVSIVDARSTPLFARGTGAGPPIDAASADASAAFFTVRFDALREAVNMRLTETTQDRVLARAAGAGQPAPLPDLRNRMSVLVEQRSGAAAAIRLGPPDGWRVLAQHAAGSLDAAVAAVRRRNLWLSFGILASLAASVGLIVVNARRSERLAAQQMDFVATVSHELRTPLAVIRSAAQNLSAGVVHEPEQASRYGDLIEGEGRRLTDMVEQVLEYAGLSGNRRPARAAPVDCGELVRNVLASCGPLFDEGRFEVVVDVGSDVPAALADEGALRRALHNLITNALKYGTEGRWLGVSVRRGAVRRRAEVQIAVSDRGRGIAADDLAHIFEPFYRGRYAVERQIHGNGLGLSLVKRIAEAHGGRVTVKSAAGEGATFTIHLPAATADAAVTPLSAPAPDAGSSHG